MKILLPLHNESPNELLNLDLMYQLQTNDLPENYQQEFYVEAGKLLYCFDKKLINDKICGFSQNRKFFYNLIKKELIKEKYKLSYEDILNNYDIILTIPIEFKENNILFQHCNGDILKFFSNQSDLLIYIDQLKTIFTNNEMNYLISENKISFHSLFITKQEIFYDLAKYVKDKIEIYKNLPIIQNILNDETILKRKKFCGWLLERLLNIYCFNNNLKIYYEHMIEKHINDPLNGQYTIF